MQSFKSNFDFSKIENILFTLDDDHSGAKLSQLKNEINKFFFKAQCKEVLYTVNNDKLFFGMRVYPEIDGDDVLDIMADDKPKAFEKYYIEFDSKLFDPMLGLDEKECDLCANIYALGQMADPIKNVDLLVPTYIKDVEAKKACY